MVELSIVIPAYNEEDCIQETINSIFLVVGANLEGTEKLDSVKSNSIQNQGNLGKIDIEIIVVNDGSQDDTYNVVKKISNSDSRVKIYSHEKNCGFGEAIRTGIKNCTKNKILLIPADGQFDCQEIPKFLDALEQNDLVIGTRLDRKGYGLFRRFVSWMYINSVNLLFGQCYRDTNWVQAWRREIFDKIQPVSKGVFFLQETITLARRAGFRIGTVDSRHLERKEGRAKGGNVKVIVFAVYEMLKFWAIGR